MDSRKVLQLFQEKPTVLIHFDYFNQQGCNTKIKACVYKWWENTPLVSAIKLD